MNKNLFLRYCGIATIFISFSLCSSGQVNQRNPASDPYGLSVDLNLLTGFQIGTPLPTNILSNYPNYLTLSSATNKQPTITNNQPVLGFGLEGTYNINMGRFGIGTGVFLSMQSCSMNLDTFIVQFKNTDFQNEPFRQIITSLNPIKEKIQTTIINIPILLKYRFDVTSRLEMSIDGGVLLNQNISSTYTTNAQFNYEAIYYYGKTGSINNEFGVVWNTASNIQWQVKKSTINTDAFWDSLINRGYNVKLSSSPDNKSSIMYKTSMMSDLGLFFRLQGCYHIKRNISLLAGLSFTMQSFQPAGSAGYEITNKVGTYNSLYSSLSKISNNNIGINIGVRYIFKNYNKYKGFSGTDYLQDDTNKENNIK